MGKVVGAFGQGHILFHPHGAEAAADRVYEGYKAVGRRIRALKPDLLVVISGDHLFNLGTSYQMPYAVGVADEYLPWGDTDVPVRPFAGQREFGEGLVRFGAEQDFDLAKLEAHGFRPDHGISVPVMFAAPRGDLPVVPININICMEPLPNPRRCQALGNLLKKYVEQCRPVGERVVVIGAGGLSHWLMVDRDGEINEIFDRHVLALIEAGRGDELAEMTAADLLATAGNGGMETLYWITMLATVPGARGETIFYEPMYSWKTGIAATQLHV